MSISKPPKRTVRLEIVLTEDEAALIYAAAREEGLYPAPFVRMSAYRAARLVMSEREA